MFPLLWHSKSSVKRINLTLAPDTSDMLSLTFPAEVRYLSLLKITVCVLIHSSLELFYITVILETH